MNRFISLFILSTALYACMAPMEISTFQGIGEFHNLFNSALDDGIACYRIPALVTAPNGDLLVAIDERVPSCGDLKWSDDINIVMRKSSDNGETWSNIIRLIDDPLGESASDPSMLVDKETGEIHMFYNYMNLNTEKDVYYLKVITSNDNGRSWSEPRDITSEITKPEWHKDFKFITSGRGIQTQDGKLVHTLVNLDHGLHIFGSDDHGKTWKFYDLPITPANESKIIELNDGSWMINSRTNGSGLRYVHQSSDFGRSWSSTPDSSLIDPSCNASIIRYSAISNGANKNRILFANANSSKERTNMTVRISYDEGQTWNSGKTIYEGPSAYSSMTVLQDGSIGLFFEKDQYQSNVFVRFSLDWLTDGKDRFEK